MGESPSARTQRELADLRRRIDADLDALADRARSDLSPRALLERNPVAVLGTIGSVAAVAATTVVARLRAARRRPDREIDRVLQKLGARTDRLKGRARKRLRERLGAEMDEAAKPDRIREAAWTTSIAALIAGATELARRFAGRLADDDRPTSAAREDRP